MESKSRDYSTSREEGEITLTYKVPLDVLYPNPEDNEEIFEKIINAIGVPALNATSGTIL